MRLNKKIIILILLFLSVLLIKNKALALTLNPEDYYNKENYNGYLDGLAPLKLQTATNSYIISISNTFDTVVVVEPYYDYDFLITRYATSVSNGTRYRLSGYNKNNNIVSGIIYYTSEKIDGSWSSWSTASSDNFSMLAPGSSVDYFYIEQKNVYCYTNSSYGLIGNDSFCDVLLPNGITLQDNILICKDSYSGNFLLLKTNSINNYFSYFVGYLYCYNSSGSKTYFDVYLYNQETSSFTLSKTNIDSFYVPYGVDWYYSLNQYKKEGTSTPYVGFGDFFDFYYEYKYFPSISNTTSNLASGIDTVLIFPGDFKKTEDFYFAILHTEEVEVEETGTSFTKEVVDYSTKLNADSPYFLNVYAGEVEDFWFEISPSVYADLLEKDKQYIFRIQYDYNDETYYNDIYATWGGLTAADIEQNEKEEERYQEQLDAIYNQTEKIKEQTDAIKEQTEVSKGIWGTLKEVLSYINPLSENFFAYKLINLLIDGLKSLFLPDERIF